jgi:hypothetical protein
MGIYVRPTDICKQYFTNAKRPGSGGFQPFLAKSSLIADTKDQD